MILYSTDCPLCKTLEMKLKHAGVPYTKITDTDEMEALGFQSVPMMYSCGKYMNFSEAMDYLNEFHKEKLKNEDQHQTG